MRMLENGYLVSVTPKHTLHRENSSPSLKKYLHENPMDFSRWTEMHLNPNPNRNPLPLDPHPPSYSSSFLPYYPQNPNPSPSLTLSHSQSSLKPLEYYSSVNVEPTLRPPGVDSYASLRSYTQHSHVGFEGQVGLSYRHQQTVDAGSVAVPSGYYWDPIAQNWAVKESVRQFGADPVGYVAAGVTTAPNGTEQLVNANPNPILWTNPTIQPHGNGTWKKRPKKTKIVQSAYCEVCKIDCNSKDVLDQHKLGKKHMKNLEKHKEAIAPAPSTSAGSNNHVIGPQENPDKGKSVGGQKSRKAAAEPVEDLETKRRKIVQSGAAVEAVRACAICNVVCNSETVFNYHLAGQKHAAMAKKHAS